MFKDFEDDRNPVESVKLSRSKIFKAYSSTRRDFKEIQFKTLDLNYPMSTTYEENSQILWMRSSPLFVWCEVKSKNNNRIKR